MPTYNLTVVDQDTLVVQTVPDAPIVVVNTPQTNTVAAPAGQGPPGPQNLFVGPTPPSNPYVGLVWADTSSTEDVPTPSPAFIWAVIST